MASALARECAQHELFHLSGGDPIRLVGLRSFFLFGRGLSGRSRGSFPAWSPPAPRAVGRALQEGRLRTIPLLVRAGNLGGGRRGLSTLRRRLRRLGLDRRLRLFTALIRLLVLLMAIAALLWALAAVPVPARTETVAPVMALAPVSLLVGPAIGLVIVAARFALIEA